MKNLYRIEGGIVFIATRANGVDLEAKIDLIDLPIIDAYQGTWGAMWSPKSRTHYMKHDNKGGGNKRSTTFMHRLIMGIDGQNWEAGMVDHKDFNGLNNTRLNLRVVNKSDNMLNRSRPPTTNTTGVLGVGRLRGKWRATISYRKKFRHLGLFDSKVEAEKAVLAAREKLMTGDEEVIKNVMRPRETLGGKISSPDYLSNQIE